MALSSPFKPFLIDQTLLSIMFSADFLCANKNLSFSEEKHDLLYRKNKTPFHENKTAFCSDETAFHFAKTPFYFCPTKVC